MLRLPFNIAYPLLAPEDILGGGGGNPSDKSTYDILGEDTPLELDLDDDKSGKDGNEPDDNQEEEETKKGEKKPEKEKGKKKSDSGDDDDTDDEDILDDDDDGEDELKELEEELEGPDDDKLELTTPVRRKDILKKYPNLFKDFPYLERAYYREQQFTELLPTIDDAKEAVEKSKTLDKFEADLLGGNTEKILSTVKEMDSNAFAKIVDDYLPTLARVDERAYFHVLGNISKMTIQAMVSEARRSGNEALQNAALLLNQFVFGTSEFTPPSKLAKENPEGDKKNDELSHRERQFVQRQFETARDDLSSRVQNVLKATIESNIDPKDSMTEYVKKNASREAMETLQSLIQKDGRFKTLLDKLWENAFRNDFDKQSLDKIRSAYLSKAKTLLPAVIKKARNEALKGIGKRVRNEADDTDDNIETTDRKGPAKKGSPASPESRNKKINFSGKPEEEARKIPRNMSTLDILMQD